jgi:hypothetical protein
VVDLPRLELAIRETERALIPSIERVEPPSM